MHINKQKADINLPFFIGSIENSMKEKIPFCKAIIDFEIWPQLSVFKVDDPEDEQIVILFEKDVSKYNIPAYIPELARIELAIFNLQSHPFSFESPKELEVNPGLHVLPASWLGLLELLQDKESEYSYSPGHFVLIWPQPDSGEIKSMYASNDELLALKVVLEEIDPQELAKANQITVGRIDAAIDLAVQRGLLISPKSSIIRSGAGFDGALIDKDYLQAEVFTLQWHITQACDLHCKHCYDRTSRKHMSLEEGIRIIDDFRDFCRRHHVDGQISFTGGNPLLYPHFIELYRAASERNLGLAIMGNPAAKELIEEIITIQVPAFFQVSLEGLPEHNDFIRGDGHFEKIISFLQMLKDLNIYTMVMLTLTRENMDQVLPLAEILEGKTDLFTFNRLAMVGEGANLASVDKTKFKEFLQEFSEAAKTSSVLALKDNLINILRYKDSIDLFGGCAGFGCGAAFNFVSLLADGEVHACRKLPSKIGDINTSSLADIYDSNAAAQYRAGSKACRSCSIRPVCGGCLAVVYGQGLDPFTDLDPYCFMDQEKA